MKDENSHEKWKGISRAATNGRRNMQKQMKEEICSTESNERGNNHDKAANKRGKTIIKKQIKKNNQKTIKNK